MKKNWIYIILLCFIIAVNILSRIGEKPVEEAQIPPQTEEATQPKATLFVEFEEAKEKSGKIEAHRFSSHTSLLLAYELHQNYIPSQRY